MTKREKAEADKEHALKVADISRKMRKASELIVEAHQDLMKLAVVDSEVGRQTSSARAQTELAAAEIGTWAEKLRTTLAKAVMLAGRGA